MPRKKDSKLSNRPSEFAIQRATAILFRHVLVETVWFHVPNGEPRSPAIARKLKEMGVRSGVADFLLFTTHRKIAFEEKTRNGVLSKNQKDFRTVWEAIGGIYLIGRSLEDAKNVIRDYQLR